MIIYRMTGKREAFQNCGLLVCDPIADVNKDRLIKAVKAMSADLDERNLKHTLIVKKLTLQKFDQALAIRLFGEEGFPEILVENEEVIGAFASKDLPPAAKLMPEPAPKSKEVTGTNLYTSTKAEIEEYEDDLPF